MYTQLDTLLIYLNNAFLHKQMKEQILAHENQQKLDSKTLQGEWFC